MKVYFKSHKGRKSEPYKKWGHRTSYRGRRRGEKSTGCLSRGKDLGESGCAPGRESKDSSVLLCVSKRVKLEVAWLQKTWSVFLRQQHLLCFITPKK